MDNLSAAWLYPIILIAGALQAWGPPMNNALKKALVNPWLGSLVSEPAGRWIDWIPSSGDYPPRGMMPTAAGGFCPLGERTAILCTCGAVS